MLKLAQFSRIRFCRVVHDRTPAWSGRLTLLLLAGFAPRIFAADVDRGDALARSAIFGRANLADVLGVRERSVGLPPQERYQLLRQQVLPAEDGDAIRIEIDFTPAYPPPPVAGRLALGGNGTGARGGDLISPAMDLVATARKLGRLDELQREIERRGEGHPESTLEQLSLLTLVAIGAGDFARANVLIGDIYRLASARSQFPSERPAEAVVAWTAVRHPQLRDVTRDLVYLLFEQTRLGNAPRSERWHRHVHSLKNSLDSRVEKANRDDGEDAPVPLRRWIPVTRQTAETCGRGYPIAGWVTADGAARHVTSHAHDYLYYSIPLNGDFDVEADLTTFDHRDIHLAAGGIYAGPGYDRKACLVGSFRKDFRPVPIDPPLTRVFTWLRARISVRDGVRTSCINGRKVYEAPHGGDPWVGVHSAWYASGTVRNLRVTGDVTVPDEIDLMADTKLPGWLPWFDETVGEADSDWQLTPAAALEPREEGLLPVLVGRRRSELSGTLLESHLRYHRPVAEDGVISYEFFYRPGECDVHPALKRMVFLLDPAGVMIHWTTAGRFDRTGLDPQNVTDNPENRRGEGPLPLHADAWNRMEVELLGDRVRLLLNDTLVYERELAPGSDRTFGLFHYADQSEALVRRLVWRGDWPRAVPEPHEQELADDSLERELAAGPTLTATFSHDFAQGIPQGLFHIFGGAWEDHVELLPDGLRITQPGGNYAQVAFVPQLILTGNFDVEVEFEDLQTSVSTGGEGNVHVLVELDDDLFSQCRIYRKGYGFSDRVDEQLMQAAIFQDRGGETHFDFPKSPPGESTSGRMRLSRRGRKIFFLFADEDSPHYQLIHSQEISEADTREAGVRVVVETHKKGESIVTWKRLDIRAESMSGLATEPMATLDELDRQRDELEQEVQFDFARDLPLSQFQVWGTLGTFRRDRQGLRVEMPGFDRWTATGLAPQLSLDGDFDLTLELDVLKLEAAAANQESTVYLQAELNDERGTAVETKYSISSSGRREVEVQLRRRKPDGEFRFDELSRTQSDTIHELRLARRDDIVYFIFRDKPGNHPIVLSRVRAGDGPVLETFVRALVHTGGADRTTVARFRKLHIRADKLAGVKGNRTP
ncbi:hypothetical protein Mal4_23950 [Maioricimonas rarisocia]|uniref:Uncharacterized protein n=1 Tax=Maioricimonas rarisocia TaxID=2528026 RepID=A0A517Z6I7_9PLAN|nr:DUF1583 domain-containing protein [Maioricimonas rarisocia]QDU38075.1 hypothetical protein Mal4_23950 [Maioricimonas rarisocia]